MTTAQPAAGTAINAGWSTSLIWARDEVETSNTLLKAGTGWTRTDQNSGANFGTDVDGRYLTGAGISNLVRWQGVAAGPEYTLFAIVKYVSNGATQAIIDCDDGGTIRRWQWKINANGTVTFIGFDSVLGVAVSVTSTATVSTTVPTAVLARVRNVAGTYKITLYVGATAVAETNYGGNGTPGSRASNEFFSQGDRVGGSQVLASKSYFEGYWNRGLSDAEMAALGANGWAIYDAPPAGPTISVHPSNQTVTTPATATFGVTAAASGGGTLSYQWQRSTNGGGAWSNVTTGTGGTTNSYTTAATSVSGGNANNADQWRCVVTETGGTNAGTANSNAATLTVNAAPTGPTINTQPTNQTVTAPATASFSVTATTSGGALSYQWQRSTNGGGAWSNVTTGTGGTTANYTTAATTVTGGNANNADQWRCVVTDSNGSTNSSAATLTVNAAAGGPTINTPPSNQTVTTPATATFTVAATTSGGALSYQWQRSTNSGGSWANVSTGTGGTTSSYTTGATTVTGGGANNADQYRCAVTDSNGTTNSSAATLTVNAAAGRITTPPLKNNTGTLLASISGWTVNVFNQSTGALVVQKTGQATDSSGIITFTDAAVSAGTAYAYECVHATYGRRCPTATAT